MQEILVEHLKSGMILTLVLSMPIVLTAAVVGLVIGILQAVTQVQEQTIAAAPKIIMVFAVVILGSGFMLEMMTAYTRESAQVAFTDVVTGGDAKILPPIPKRPRKKVLTSTEADAAIDKRATAIATNAQRTP
jgi:flagellar biosynthetic protein FliQ